MELKSIGLVCQGMNDWQCGPRTLNTQDALKRENEGERGERILKQLGEKSEKRGCGRESRLITPSVPTVTTACSVLPQYSA